jgi:hypothetical protein
MKSDTCDKTVGIVTFDVATRHPQAGSSRIRARWLLRYWPEAEIFAQGRKYRAVVFQKVYWLEYARRFDGLKILDVCDPDFLDWRAAPAVIEMMDACDAVTASTSALAAVLKRYTATPVRHVPDRLDLESFARHDKKDHRGRGRTTTVAWYGYGSNLPMLESIVDTIVENEIPNLIVISDRCDYALPVQAARHVALENVTWDLGSVDDHLLRADVVLNPQASVGRWKYKSDNKTAAAWALGLPVAHNSVELCQLMTEEARVREADYRLKYVYENYDVRRSVDEYRALMAELGERALQ